MKTKEKEYREYNCPVCGEKFRISSFLGWGWVIGSETSPKPVCSYKCQRKWEKDPSVFRRRVSTKR